MNVFLGLSLKAWIVVAVAVFAAGSFGYVAFRGNGEAEVFSVVRRDVGETVLVTGAVEAATAIDMEFLSSGRVVSRPVKVGDRVSEGALLMAIDGRDLDIQIQRAEANLANSRAKLEQLKVGATPETIRQLENAVDSEYRETLSAVDAAMTKADNALSLLRAYVFQGNNMTRTELYLLADSGAAKAESEKVKADSDLQELARLRAAVFIQNQAGTDVFFREAPLLLESVRIVGASATDLLRRVVSPAVTETTIKTYISEITTARAGLDTALATFSAGISSIQAAKDALLVKKEPPRLVDLAIFEANVKAAEADLALLQKQRGDARIITPVSGTVTKLEYEVGETARAGVTAVSLNASSGFEIEANVPEIDIAKIKIGNPVSITLDAIPNEKFAGKVTHVDPAGTDVGGITNYLIRVVFDATDPRIRAGITANLDIETVKKIGVLALPQMAIMERDGKAWVKKISGDKVTEVLVTVGIRGTDGWVEVLEGVSEGDKVLEASAEVSLGAGHVAMSAAH